MTPISSAHGRGGRIIPLPRHPCCRLPLASRNDAGARQPFRRPSSRSGSTRSHGGDTIGRNLSAPDPAACPRATALLRRHPPRAACNRSARARVACLRDRMERMMTTGPNTFPEPRRAPAASHGCNRQGRGADDPPCAIGARRMSRHPFEVHGSSAAAAAHGTGPPRSPCPHSRARPMGRGHPAARHATMPLSGPKGDEDAPSKTQTCQGGQCRRREKGTRPEKGG